MNEILELSKTFSEMRTVAILPSHSWKELVEKPVIGLVGLSYSDQCLSYSYLIIIKSFIWHQLLLSLGSRLDFLASCNILFNMSSSRAILDPLNTNILAMILTSISRASWTLTLKSLLTPTSFKTINYLSQRNS